MKYKFGVRPATIEDYEEVERLFHESDAYHHKGYPEYFCEPVRPSRSKAYLRELIWDDDRQVFLVQDGEEVISFCELYVHDHTNVQFTYPRRSAYLAAIYFEQSKRGVLSITPLAEALIEWSKERGVVEICGDIYEFNERALSMAFRRFGVTKRYSHVFIPVQPLSESSWKDNIESRYKKKLRRLYHRFRSKWPSSD